uniref:Uncharacterized protein n=1 Tax=Human betaherpesvirus 6 TaxID=10368 RepID=A0A5P9U401_9BETA|nr:hypothetical protein [Human betaherpesvirus 6]
MQLSQTLQILRLMNAVVMHRLHCRLPQSRLKLKKITMKSKLIFGIYTL